MRRELHRADPATTEVSDVANDWGFWHLGWFAADYRRLFGEPLLATLARAAIG
jgi:AraC family ethanolamine operon transcriptional activator